MARKTGLGKGLDALIPPRESEAISGGVNQVHIKNIRSNPHQPRSKFDQREMAELAASIKEHGVLQPLIVTQEGGSNQYTLIAGERRLQAAKMVELVKVPVVVREVSERELVELALVENVQRTDLAPLEAAEAYRQLNKEFNLSHDEIAKRVGKDRTTISNTIGLLDLAEAVKTALADGKISEGHARALKSLPTAQAQSAAVQTVIERGLNVRQTEELVRKLKGVKPRPKPRTPVSPEIKAVEQRLEDSFPITTRVRVNHGRKGGTVVIYYYSDEDLNALVDLLTGDNT
jgi:ParB family chromosome partitioning protein